jgi:alcohol dehydrogenase class IV
MSASAVHNLAHRHASSPGLELVHDGLPSRIRFGAGESRKHLRAELDGLGARRAWVLSSPTHTSTLRGIVASLNEHGIDTTIVDAYAQDYLEGPHIVAAAGGAALIAVGGNTITGRAKQAASQQDVPLIVLPTTYSGTELDARLPRQTTASYRSRGSLPAAIIYDPRLARTLSARQAGLSLLAATGNALRAITEAPDGSLPQLLAVQGLRQLSRAALDVLFNPGSLQGPTAAQFGAYLSGAAAAVSPTSAQVDATLANSDDGERFQLARAALVRRAAGNLARCRSDGHNPRVPALDGIEIEVFVEQLIQAAGLTADLPTAHLC